MLGSLGPPDHRTYGTLMSNTGGFDGENDALGLSCDLRFGSQDGQDPSGFWNARWNAPLLKRRAVLNGLEGFWILWRGTWTSNAISAMGE